MKARIHVMLIEDNPQYRDAIDFALDKISDIKLESQFGTAEFALRSMEDSKSPARPDVILLDLNLPGMRGLEAISHIAAAAPDAKIIILTQSDKQADVLSAIQRGAAGYLLKSATPQQIEEGIRTVMKGGASLDWSIAQYILQEVKAEPRKLTIDNPLSSREMEILKLLSEGLARKEISVRLDISRGSVATYISRIFEKLQVQNSTEAVAKAYGGGLLPPSVRP